MLYVYSQSITRPANTDAYTARDAIGTAATHVLTFKTNGNSGLIFNAEVVDSVHTTTHTAEIWLFSVAPAAQADNAAFAPTDAEMLNHLGTIVCDTALTTGANRIVYPSTRPALNYTGSIYGCLVAIGGTTPTSGEVFTVKLHVKEE